DAVSSLGRGGELTVRNLDAVWGMIDSGSLVGFKSWVQNHAAFMAQSVYSSLALPAWAATGGLGVIFGFVFGRRHKRFSPGIQRTSPMPPSLAVRAITNR